MNYFTDIKMAEQYVLAYIFGRENVNLHCHNSPY